METREKISKRGRTASETIFPKRCVRCGKIKDSTEFFRSKEAKDGRKPSCKPCERGRKAKVDWEPRFTLADWDRTVAEGRCIWRCMTTGSCQNQADVGLYCPEHRPAEIGPDDDESDP